MPLLIREPLQGKMKKVMKIIDKAIHLFIPWHSNNQKARLLHSPILFLIIIGLILFQLGLRFLPVAGVRILGYAANISPDEVIRLTNEKRTAIGLNSLTANDSLAQAAQAKGADMLNDNYWAHVAPDGTQPWKFITDAGYKYRYAGENLARDFSNPNTAVEAWMASTTHRENILSPKYKEIGIAVVEGDMNGVDTTIIVQFFGTQYIDTTPAVPIAKAETEIAATISPTQTPAPVAEAKAAEEYSQTSPVFSQPSYVEVERPSFLVSPLDTTKKVSLATTALLMGVMVVDVVVTTRKGITRISGRTFAHLAFLGMVLAIVIIAKAGAIL
jgi:hypothetical protein